MYLYVPMTRNREKRRAWDENGSNRSCCGVSPGDELFSEGQICMVVPTMEPIHPPGTRPADTPPRRLPPAHDITAVLVWLDSAKISTFFPPRAKSLSIGCPLPCGRTLCPLPWKQKISLWPSEWAVSLQPYLKDTGLQWAEKVQQGTPPKTLILMIKGFRRDISYSSSISFLSN